MCVVSALCVAPWLCTCVYVRAGEKKEEERQSGRMALVYHYHVDATALSSDAKGHINSVAARSHVEGPPPPRTSSGFLC